MIAAIRRIRCAVGLHRWGPVKTIRLGDFRQHQSHCRDCGAKWARQSARVYFN